jgi:hypothetical protein
VTVAVLFRSYDERKYRTFVGGSDYNWLHCLHVCMDWFITEYRTLRENLTIIIVVLLMSLLRLMRSKYRTLRENLM